MKRGEKMTDDEKVDFMVTYLTEHHLEAWGGYPKPGRWFGDVFVYCDTRGDTDKWDEICAYRRADLIKWMDAALAEEKDSDDLILAILSVDRPKEFDGDFDNSRKDDNIRAG